MISRTLSKLSIITVLVMVQATSPSTSQAQDLSPAQTARAVLSLLNKARANGAECGDKARLLSWNTKLAESAIKHATDMADGGFLAHTGSDGSSAQDRLERVDYNWIAYGENISHGQDSPQEAVSEWLDSQAHCKNIMNPDFKEIGAAKVGEFWIVIFGSRP